MAKKGNDSEDNEGVVESEEEAFVMDASSSPKKKDAPAKFPVSELLDLTTRLIPEVDKPFAVGAMRHAGAARTDMMTTEEFKSKVEAFKNVRAF